MEMNLPPFIDIPPVRHNNEKETTYLVPYAQSNIPGFPDTEGNLSDTTDEIRKLLSKDIADLELKLECMEKRLDAMEIERSERDDTEHHLYNNTGGFHLGCILSSVMASEPDTEIGFLKHPLLAAIASISLVLIQLISLNILEIENRLIQFNYHQDCTELNGCSTKYYCEISEEKCWDCKYLTKTCTDDFNSTDADFSERYSNFEI